MLNKSLILLMLLFLSPVWGQEGKEEPLRNSRGQLIVEYDEWVDIARIAQRVGEGDRYQGYLWGKRYCPSLQRVEFLPHPQVSRNNRWDLSAPVQEVEEGLVLWQEEQAALARQKAVRDSIKAEARKTLPIRERLITEARDTINAVRERLRKIRIQSKNEVSARRVVMRKTHNKALMKIDADADSIYSSSDKTIKAEIQNLIDFLEEEKVSIYTSATLQKEQAAVDFNLSVAALPSQVAIEFDAKIKSLEATIAACQYVIDAKGFAPEPE